MKPILLIVLVGALILAGCTTTRRGGDDEPRGPNFGSIVSAGDPSKCVELGSRADECISAIALNKKDASLCMTIGESYVAEDCRVSVLKEKGDIQGCLEPRVADDSRRSDCLLGAAHKIYEHVTDAEICDVAWDNLKQASATVGVYEHSFKDVSEVNESGGYVFVGCDVSFKVREQYRDVLGDEFTLPGAYAWVNISTGRLFGQAEEDPKFADDPSFNARAGQGLTFTPDVSYTDFSSGWQKEGNISEYSVVTPYYEALRVSIFDNHPPALGTYAGYSFTSPGRLISQVRLQFNTTYDSSKVFLVAVADGHRVWAHLEDGMSENNDLTLELNQPATKIEFLLYSKRQKLAYESLCCWSFMIGRVDIKYE